MSKPLNILMYSKREENVLKEAFLFLMNTGDAIKGVETLIDPEETDELCLTLINMSQATGTTFQMCRIFIEDEFKKSSGNQLEGSIMRGNSIATKLTKAYLNKIGQKYLQMILGPIVHQLCVVERKKSYEVDASKCESPDEVDKNKVLLIEKTKEVVDKITSQSNIDNMPPEMRVIAGYFAEFAHKYAPKQVWALVGGFLLLRYMNPALMTPEAYGLLPEGKVPSAKPRRNLILLTKILQNLSNGVEFGKKEQYMMCCNDFIKDNKERMERYLENVITFASKGVTSVPDPTAIGVTDLHFLHRIFTQNTEKINALFPNPEEGQKFQKLLEKLGSYQSKISFSFLNSTDRKCITDLLEKNREEAAFIGMVDKKKRGKVQKRLLVVGRNRIMSVKPGSGKLAREAHLLDLTEIKSSNPKELELIFKNFSIVCDSDQTDDIIYVVRKAFEANFSGMPKKLQFKLTIEPPSRIDEITNDEAEVCGGFVNTYQSLCNYYNTAPNEDVCWHFQNLPRRVKVIDLKHFTRSYTDQPLNTMDFGPLFWSLRFNYYFENFIIKDYKLDKEGFLDLVEMLKYNRSLKTITLSNVGGTKDGFAAFFDALSMNKANVISSFDLSNNPMEDKSLQIFANFLQITPVSVVSINIDNISAGKVGLAALCNSLKDRAKIKGNSVLNYLSIADNKLSQVGSDALGGMLSQIGIHLKTLNLANTSPTLEVIFDALRKGCPHLETLDVSKNKLKPSECASLAKYLESQNSLVNLNLSQTKFPPENIKELLLSVTGCNIDLRLNLSDNGFGPQVGTLVASIAFKMANIHTLDLSDNELGEEGISALCEGLCSNTCLRSLILDNNWKSAGKARTDAIENLIKLISANPFLTGLSISGNIKASPLKHDIVPFLYALGNNTTILSLNISGHQMGNKGAIALSKALQTNHTLTSLTWDDNTTTLLGFINIKNALKVNEMLKDMPLPVYDIAQAMKNESANALQLQQVLNEIEKTILNNQQQNSSYSMYNLI